MWEPGNYIVKTDEEEPAEIGQWDGEFWQFIGDPTLYSASIVKVVISKITMPE